MNTSYSVLATASAYPSDPRTFTFTLVCQEQAPQHVRIRKRLQRRFKSSLMRVLNFAKHETLRKMHRYLHSHRALMGQEHPGAMRIAFSRDELAQDLQSLLYSEMPGMLSQSAGAALPPQDVLDFISRRQELLSGLPEELYQRVLAEISDGLTAGES